VTHDRIHAREPTVDLESWREGTVEALTERDGHAVFTVAPDDAAESVDLVVTYAVRDLVLGRLDHDGDSPVGAHVWFRRHGGD
jgi:hypothetical protein